MQTVLIVIHLMVVVALVIVVLLQRSEGGALGIGSGSGGGFFTGRGQASALTRATAILGTLFFVTSIALTVLAGWNRAPRSIFENSPISAPAPEKAPASLLDELKKMQNNSSGAPAGAPATPAASAAPTSPQVPRSQ